MVAHIGYRRNHRIIFNNTLTDTHSCMYNRAKLHWNPKAFSFHAFSSNIKKSIFCIDMIFSLKFYAPG